MKPTEILKVLDLAYTVRRNGRVFNPLFAGDAGLGKSQLIQQWVEKKRKTNPEFGYIDLRFAYMEAPDLIGLPQISKKKAKNDFGEMVESLRTSHILPEFLPTGGEGVLVLEEPNRANSSVMNALMQLLTEYKIHNWELPKGWFICGAINPDGSGYDVNTMDTALRDRFEVFDVEYDFKTFLEFVKTNNWHPNVINFIESGVWTYKGLDELGENGKYLSPRTWSKMNTVEQEGVSQDKDMHFLLSNTILGKDIGKEYHNFTVNNRPITAEDLIDKRKRKGSLEKLSKMSENGNYQGDKISVTVNTLIEAYPDKADINLVVEVAKVIPADLADGLVKQCFYKFSTKLITESIANNPSPDAALELSKIPNFSDFILQDAELLTKLKAVKDAANAATEDKDAVKK